jgi:hypothetical protein
MKVEEYAESNLGGILVNYKKILLLYVIMR